ncbi:hypothetical protein M3P19_04660 [Muricauda sp. 2012CJ35-5]|uniref:Uncharacterized protein n=1 Tax=Flagellimonas spongiicola TaxID=2942208 RepID=A0ABT0PPG5_9FLAO|nr:hypothetical protein [Allomuricauda spongiicola]MCL6273287.1 hypothetical protein [Allomuricauda spongiicola]
MKDDFTPPIKSRTTDELLEILGAPDKWNPLAVRLATNELALRDVPPKKIETAQYLSKKRDRIEKKRLADESYHICDFIFRPIPTLFEIIFSWELKKDGFDRKAKQQKYFRVIIALIVLSLVAMEYLS